MKFVEGVWWFSQSWIADALGCHERGRRKIVQPDWDWQGDGAAAGTAVHAAIQPYLEGLIGSRDEFVALAMTEAENYAENGVPQIYTDPIEYKPIVYKSMRDAEQMVAAAANCAGAWWDDIRPEVPPGGLCEVGFKVILFERENTQVGIRGTIDYAPPVDGLLLDWKNPGRPYKQWEKQRSDMQSIFYCTAAVKGALAESWQAAGKPSPLYEWPMMFMFGNAVRGSASAKGELVPVARTRGHELWLIDMLNRFVDMAEVIGFDRGWTVNPSYVLCSDKWCPWFGDCLGRYVTTELHTWKP